MLSLGACIALSGGETPIETAGILYLLVNTYSGPVPASESLTTLFFPKTLSPPLIDACAKGSLKLVRAAGSMLSISTTTSPYPFSFKKSLKRPRSSSGSWFGTSRKSILQ